MSLVERIRICATCKKCKMDRRGEVCSLSIAEKWEIFRNRFNKSLFVISIILFVEAVVLMTSCGEIHKNRGDVESYARWYFEEMYDAVKDNNLDEVIDLTYDTGEWLETLSDDEMQEFEEVGRQWANEHPYKSEVIDEYYRQHRDAIPK